MGSAGMIPIDECFEVLRGLATETGALLVVDEVITLRLSMGGGQSWAGVPGDLACFGKMLGGGFPLGAFGGRADVMDAFDPTGDDGPALGHPGSMNAWAVGLAAAGGDARPADTRAHPRAGRAGKDLRRRLKGVAVDRGVPLTVTGAGSLFGLHFTGGPVRTFRDTWSEDRELALAVYLGLINEGVLTDPRGAGCLSTVTADEDLDLAVEAFDRVLTRLG